MVGSLSVGAAFGASRFLFSRILRTRSGRKNVVSGSVIVLPSLALALAAGACKSDAPPSEPELPPERSRQPPSSDRASIERMQRELAGLASEAGLDPETDPVPPSGDLKGDIASFAGLEACVRAHGARDPVLADAIDALGYDTLARDACRMLEALGAQDVRPCKPIASSTLRSRCEENVAVLLGNASLCPLSGLRHGDGRDPLCLARASRDDRLCTAVEPARRSICKALVGGDAQDCHGDTTCVREVERWKSVVEKPAKHDAATARLHVEITPQKGTPDPPVRSFDFDEEALGGAVVRIVGDRARVSLGTPRSPYWASWDSEYARPQVFLEVAGSRGEANKASRALATTDLTLDLLLPKVGLFSALTSDERTVEGTAWPSKMGDAVKLVLTAELHDGPQVYKTKIDVDTFVRDVVEPAAAGERAR
jgi:hypothetical protein